MAKSVHWPATGLHASEALPLISAGIVGGISFFAQTVKFRTPDLSLTQIVSVGATIFDASHLLQIALLTAIAIWVPRAKIQQSRAWLMTGTAVLVLGIQMAWITPALDARLALMKAGIDPGTSVMHLVYVAVELVKVGMLVGLAWLPRSTADARDIELPVGVRVARGQAT